VCSSDLHDDNYDKLSKHFNPLFWGEFLISLIRPISQKETA
jgi:hypothetical protein